MWCPLLLAQEAPEAKPLPLGGFDNTGSVTLGYRFTDVKGYRPMFDQILNLRKGFRLEDFNLFGDSKEDAGPFADNYSLSASGLGGDPFPTAHVSLRRTNLFDFRANWRQSTYFWNQNDNVILPITVPARLSTGLTNDHDWAIVRKMGSADMTLHATNSLRFNFNYQRSSTDGAAFTTRTMDFFDSPRYWGSFARANAYYLAAPRHDNTNRFTGGIDYTERSWSLHYRIGYQTFNESSIFNNALSPEASINGIASSAAFPLSNYSSSLQRRFTTPISEFSFVGKPHAKLDWRGGYIYYRYQGPASLDESMAGMGPTSTSGVTARYSASQAMRADVTAPSHLVNQGFTYHLKSWWELSTDYRYSRSTSEAAGNFQSILNGDTPALGDTHTAWKYGLSDLDVAMLFTPLKSVVIRPGVHLMKADIEGLEEGITDPGHTRRIKTVRPELSFGYQPSRVFSVRGSFHSMTSGASYTAISPHTQVGTHLIFRFQPVQRLSLEDDLYIVNNKLLDANFQSNSHSNSVILSYAWSERFSFFGGISYNSFFAAGDVIYRTLRSSLFDQEVNRVWQTGLEARPTKRAGVRFSFNFDRSTGLGQINGEPPAYGPVSWPYGTGTLFYDFPKAGRLSVDLQRTYYIEEIVRANNFSANMLTIRWTRGF